MNLTVLVAGLLAATLSQIPTTMAQQYTSDDYGFPVESPSTTRNRPRQSRAYWSSARAVRRMRNACDYSKDVYRYSQQARKIEPAIMKAESEELGRNINKSQQELATTTNEVGNDPDAVAAVKSINEHLAAAAKHHKMLHEECGKEAVDGKACMTCCNTILQELDKAQLEHDALMRSMEMKTSE